MYEEKEVETSNENKFGDEAGNSNVYSGYSFVQYSRGFVIETSSPAVDKQNKTD